MGAVVREGLQPGGPAFKHFFPVSYIAEVGIGQQASPRVEAVPGIVKPNPLSVEKLMQGLLCLRRERPGFEFFTAQRQF